MKDIPGGLAPRHGQLPTAPAISLTLRPTDWWKCAQNVAKCPLISLGDLATLWCNVQEKDQSPDPRSTSRRSTSDPGCAHPLKRMPNGIVKAVASARHQSICVAHSPT